MQEQKLRATVLYTSHRKCLRIWELRLTAKLLLFQVRVTLLSTLRRNASSWALRLLLFRIQTDIYMMKMALIWLPLRKSKRLREAESRNILNIVLTLSTQRARVSGQSSVILLFRAQLRTNFFLMTQRHLLQTAVRLLQRALICLQLLTLQSTYRRTAYTLHRVRLQTQAALLLQLLK